MKEIMFDSVLSPKVKSVLREPLNTPYATDLWTIKWKYSGHSEVYSIH